MAEDDGDGGAPRPIRTFALTALAVVLVGLGLLVPREMRTDDPGPYPTDGPEHQLATLDGARTDASQLDRYAEQLDTVERACRQSRAQLAELAATAQRRADTAGVRATTRWLLASVDVQAREGAQDCREAFDEAARRATWCEPRGERPCGF